MADRSPQNLGETLLTPTYYPATAGAGDRVQPGAILHIKNANAAALTITFVTPGTVDVDLAIADRTRGPIGAGTDAFITVPKDPAYRDVDRLVQITWSVTSSVTFATMSKA